MQNFLKKLTSRKFLAALAGVATGLAMVFGVDETTISTVAGAVTTRTEFPRSRRWRSVSRSLSLSRW